MIKKEEIKEKILKLKDTGFFSIFLATVFSKVITFLGGIILVRILSKSDYGIYAYVNNCFSMLFLLNDLGIASAALQYLTENNKNEEKQIAILKYTIKISLIVSIATALIILLSPYFYPYTMAEGKHMTPVLFLVPVITIISSVLSVVLRANLENKKYSKLQIFTTAVTYIVLILFSIILGWQGAVISKYVYEVIILIYSICLSYYYIRKIKKKNNNFDREEKKGFIKYAFASWMNNTISSLLLVIDTFLIGYMIATPEIVATYNVGSKLPYALTFLPTCIAIYIIPYFIQHNKEPKWLHKNFHTLIKYSLLGFGVLCTLLIILSKPIFAIVFGEQYYDAIPIYIFLVIGLFFASALKYPCVNILSSLRKVKVTIIINIICFVVNFISNIIFIRWLGIVGAAITTMITDTLAAVIYVLYLRSYLRRLEELNDTK